MATANQQFQATFQADQRRFWIDASHFNVECNGLNAEPVAPSVHCILFNYTQLLVLRQVRIALSGGVSPNSWESMPVDLADRICRISTIRMNRSPY